MTAKRKTLTPNRDTGWNRKHTVEIHLVARNRPTHDSVYAVYLNGVLVGHVLGHARYLRNPPAWGYTLGADQPRMGAGPYWGESRRYAIEALVEKVLRESAR